jgi:hypothetical protein
MRFRGEGIVSQGSEVKPEIVNNAANRGIPATRKKRSKRMKTSN